MSLEVNPLRSRRDLREFIDLPYRLHANEPQWIPPLRLERRMFLSRRLNAWFRHADAELFLARRDGRVVGRVSAQIDHSFNDFHKNAWGMFGFLEVENDPEALAGLLDAAREWLRARGRDRMIGPMDFTINDESGVLIEGFDREPMIKQPWHPPYYMELCEASGLAKAMDLYMWELHISDKERVLPVIWELADQLERKHGITIRNMSRRGLRHDMDAFGDIYNDAWSHNWGFVPYDEKDLDQYAQELQLVFAREWFMVAEEGEKPVAIAITVPDVNQALKRMNGRLLPLGWLHFLRKKSYIDRCRVGFLGVKPAYQHTGVAAGLYAKHFEESERSRIKWGEMGWILETNTAMNRGMEAMGGRVVKKYRVYESDLVG